MLRRFLVVVIGGEGFSVGLGWIQGRRNRRRASIFVMIFLLFLVENASRIEKLGRKSRNEELGFQSTNEV